ncbi:Ni/Fe-hydrogenase, b-type cytochrome subunit [candidate division KSB1 bacterium]|nr:Ni/Fe-hydrogenase, b-type cytochrome subunit [candidate division KSB1 bacterium]
MAKDKKMQKIYVWDGPLRIFHWVNAIAFFVLFITGLMIAAPGVTTGGEPWDQFSVATTRNVHFLAANIFTVCLLFRIAWFFMGNKYSRWQRLKFYKPAYWKEVLYVAKEYFTFRHVHEKPHYVDHNALAAATYVAIYVLSVFLIVSGYALRVGIDPDGVIGGLFAWFNPLVGGEGVTRLWHHAIAWLATAISVLHILWSISYTLIVDRSALLAMFNGYKERDPGWKPSKPWEK